MIFFKINTNNFVSFLHKCRLSGLVKDLVLHAKDGQIFAKFTDPNMSMVCEVYEPNVTVTEEGTLKIASIDQIISVIGRSQSEIIGIKAFEGNQFLISDGKDAGTFKATISEIGNAEFIDSFQRLRGKELFDKEKLHYNVLDTVKYESYCDVPYEQLQIIVKDAKAFGFQNYMFSKKDGILSCKIENRATKDSFTRKLLTIDSVGDIPRVSVGMGFQEMIAALDKEPGEKGKRQIRLYFHKIATLLTDNAKFFFNLNNLV